MTRSVWQMYGMLFFALACLMAPDAIREVQAAMAASPIPRVVLKYERETKRKAMAVLDIDGSVTTYPTPAFVGWLEAKSGLRAVRRRVLLETERPLPVQVLFETVDADQLLWLCKVVR